ncbi:MAG: nucleotidyltransferase family protein [Bacteroidota bacterium]|jgi:predicted nucleotidyltransferase|nr:nucleotidyltransferase domain-containing protein [Bacteroidota bacterium]
MIQLSQEEILKISQLCQSNKVRSLHAFGSVTREDFNPNSDIDLIVDFEEKDPFAYTDLYFNLKEALERLFKRPVDLLEWRSRRNPIFQQVLDQSKVLVYG